MSGCRVSLACNATGNAAKHSADKVGATSTDQRGHDGGYIGRQKQTIADASRPRLMSKLAQLRALVSSRRRVYKDGGGKS